jgi:hypothetical protein
MTNWPSHSTIRKTPIKAMSASDGMNARARRRVTVSTYTGSNKIDQSNPKPRSKTPLIVRDLPH